MIFIAQWQALLWFSSASWEHFSLVQDFGRVTRNVKLPGREEEDRDIFPRQEDVWKGVLRVTMGTLNWQVARAGPPQSLEWELGDQQDQSRAWPWVSWLGRSARVLKG